MCLENTVKSHLKGTNLVLAEVESVKTRSEVKGQIIFRRIRLDNPLDNIPESVN